MHKNENYIASYFKGEIHQKDGYSFSQCVDGYVSHVTAFLVPLLYQEKPRRVTIRVGSTIVAAYSEEKKICWKGILLDVMQKIGFKPRQQRGYLSILLFSSSLFLGGSTIQRGEEDSCGKVLFYQIWRERSKSSRAR